jgi:beta-glucanase (GH16 family)
MRTFERIGMQPSTRMTRIAAMGLVLVAVATSCAQGEAGGTRRMKDGQGFKVLQPPRSLRPPRSWNSKVPLSDQSNNGRWEAIPTLSDEFSSNTLDTNKWQTTNPKWGGRPPGFRSPDNVKIRNGELLLEVREEVPPVGTKNRDQYRYTCGMIRSLDTQKYGYYEIRAKPAKAVVNSAFWLYKNEGATWTELDIFEIGGTSPKSRRKVHMSAHVFRTPTSEEHVAWPGAVEIDQDLYEDFHVYGLEWTRDEIKYYLDGQLIRTGKNDHWHDDLNVIVSTGISEKWFGLPERYELPAVFTVDYVRTWQKR